MFVIKRSTHWKFYKCEGKHTSSLHTMLKKTGLQAFSASLSDIVAGIVPTEGLSLYCARIFLTSEVALLTCFDNRIATACPSKYMKGIAKYR